MRKFILPLIASLAFAAPALANETRAELRGGAIWSNGQTEATYGAAVGYDFDLAPMTFAGVEVSGDKIDQSGTKVAYGITGRVGFGFGVLSLKLENQRHQRFGDITPAKLAKMAAHIRLGAE